MKARSAFLTLTAVVTLAGCGSTSPALGATDRLYAEGSIRGTMGIHVYDPGSRAMVRSLPLGVPAPDWKALYSVTAAPTPMLVATDPASGAVLRTLGIPSGFELPSATLGGQPGGLSQNGAWLVLSATPGAGSTSRLLVVDTSFASRPKAVELPGRFVFDAISNDGHRLYLIQYITSSDYHVRVFDLIGGRLETYTVSDKRESGTMQGLRISGVYSPDGQWLYSVYARKHDSPFIHALNLTSPYAWCIDLPGSGSGASSFGPDDLDWSLAMTADGSRLYAANGSTGSVALVDVRKQPPVVVKVSQTRGAPIASRFVVNAEAKEIGGNDAVLSGDEKTLVYAGPLGVMWVDASTLKGRAEQLMSQDILSLALSPSSGVLYAIDGVGSIGAVRMTDGQPAKWSWFGTDLQPVGLVRVEAL